MSLLRLIRTLGLSPSKDHRSESLCTLVLPVLLWRLDLFGRRGGVTSTWPEAFALKGVAALSLTGTAGSFNAGKLMSPIVSIKKIGSVVNHLPVMTDFNAGTADAFDSCP